MKSCFLLLFATLCAKIPCTKSQAGNVIAGVRATQSTTGAHFADASNAIDGNKDSRFRHSSCSRTRRQSRPWWRVDLENHYRVYVVSITSAKSRRCGRLNGAEIRIGDTLENNGNSNTLCARINSMPSGQTVNFYCKPAGVHGRYINIFLPRCRSSLTLCEVEAFGVHEPH
ncbi:fucolectin-like isoform X1 [Hypanus sabinus]|uniref:fucolectin-like isoform X1 n=1 Tax=Hypanus sabinus TaxID=79690 RepID=UPI0028C4D56C|nr:fucolectin-like isoform X1 [Hypanus sabinus]XP_059827521.1 fucolectin-like isoform X1 [Hypanus sabinus]XP_059827522.1 fucolectin-like isoform X1 [Hypanus sabinus]